MGVQGKRTWNTLDTQLAYMEQAVSRMRTALSIHKPLDAGQRRGMSIEQPGELNMPAETWCAIAKSIAVLAAAHDLFFVTKNTFHDGAGTIRVKFARRRGELT